MRQIANTTGAIALATVLAGCGTGPVMAPLPQSEALAWVRTDGQSGRANPALADQFATDRGACGIALAQDNASLRNAEPCMNSRGYVLVPTSQAEATAARFRAAGTVPAG